MTAPAPWSNPTTPNLADYAAFLATVAFGDVDLNELLPAANGHVTAGTTTTLTDSAESWTPNEWQNCYLYDAAAGLIVPISSNTATQLTFAQQATAPSVGDAYIIVQPIVYTSLAVAQSIVNDALACAGIGTYVLAVYDLAADRLINYAPDQPNQTFFADLRKEFRLTSISLGAVSGASDQGTSASIVNPEWMRTMTIRDIQTLKTPFGRSYMGYAQAYGSTVWALA